MPMPMQKQKQRFSLKKLDPPGSIILVDQSIPLLYDDASIIYLIICEEPCVLGSQMQCRDYTLQVYVLFVHV
jgi:hypothetical protein